MYQASLVRLARALLLAGCASLTFAGGSLATSGVAVDLREVTVTDVLVPGRTYTLPALVVRNPGDEAGPYRMSAAGVQNDDFLDPVAAWFSFTPATFHLVPGASQRVAIELSLPRSAAPGHYFGLARAEAVPEGEGALFGAAAAAVLDFSIDDTPAGAFDWLWGALVAGAPWTFLAILSGILLTAALTMRRRIGIEIRVISRQ